MPCVTPYGGVWIEIRNGPSRPAFRRVTPYGGVWIEILLASTVFWYFSVTPYGGVWIEIPSLLIPSINARRHALWGRVD